MCVFVSVALICLVLYFRKIVLSKICILYWLVFFLTLFVSFYVFYVLFIYSCNICACV